MFPPNFSCALLPTLQSVFVKITEGSLFKKFQYYKSWRRKINKHKIDTFIFFCPEKLEKIELLCGKKFRILLLEGFRKKSAESIFLMTQSESNFFTYNLLNNPSEVKFSAQVRKKLEKLGVQYTGTHFLWPCLRFKRIPAQHRYLYCWRRKKISN